MRNNKIRNVVVMIVLIFLLSIVTTEYFGKIGVEKNAKTTTGYVVSVYRLTKPRTSVVRYFYVVESDTFIYSHFVESKTNFTKLQKLKGTTLPVVYDSLDKKNSKLMIEESKFW